MMITARPDADAIVEAVGRIDKTRAREFASRIGLVCHSRSRAAIGEAVKMLALSREHYGALQDSLLAHSYGDKRAGLLATPGDGTPDALLTAVRNLAGTTVGGKAAVKCQGAKALSDGALLLPLSYERKIVSAATLMSSDKRQVDVLARVSAGGAEFSCKPDANSDYQAMRHAAAEAIRRAGWTLQEFKLDALRPADRIQVFDAVFVANNADWQIDDIVELTVKHDRASQRSGVEDAPDDEENNIGENTASDEKVGEEGLSIIRQAALAGTGLRMSPEVQAWVSQKGCYFTSATVQCHHNKHDVSGQVTVRFFEAPTMLQVTAGLADRRSGKQSPGEMNEQAIEHFWGVAVKEYKAAHKASKQ